MRGIVRPVAHAAAALGMVTAVPALAANISYNPELRTIIVDGSIETGDFERIRTAFD